MKHITPFYRSINEDFAIIEGECVCIMYHNMRGGDSFKKVKKLEGCKVITDAIIALGIS